MAEPRWALLVYTVPARPSRLRAAVWRAVKRLGAVYLRDGVCALPERSVTLAGLRALAAEITAFGGDAAIIERARLDPVRAAAVREESLAARRAEYADIAAEADRVLLTVRREAEHHPFTPAEVAALESDLEKLRRWAAQVRARDHFGAGHSRDGDLGLDRIGVLLARLQTEAIGREAVAS